MSDAKIEIHEFMERPGGARALGFTPVDGVSVLIEPRDASMQKRARQLATAFTDAALEQEAQQLAINAVQAANEVLAKQLSKARARIAELESACVAAATGRRRFFGPVLMRPVRPGDWTGEVMLLDPVKQERGQSLVFASLAELRKLHPELWVVEAGMFGVLLDALEPKAVLP